MNPFSHKNLPYWKFKDVHKGKPGLLICNGPSLADVPHKIFAKYLTLGSNSIYTHPWLGKRPVNYYFIEGANHLRTPEEREARMPYLELVAEWGHFSFVNRRFVQFFQHIPNVYSIDYLDANNRNLPLKGWSYDPFVNHATGASVTYAMLQFAFYFGFNPLLIVGMDHKFTGEDWHYYKDEEAAPFKSMTKAEYDNWKPRAEFAYSIAQRTFQAKERTLLNLTPDTACNVFEKDKLENWL